MDPIRQLTTPIAEVRAAAPIHIDEYGEAWAVIDGIETKIPRIAAAKALLAKQDRVRMQIRADLDATGIRECTEQVQLTIEGKPQFDSDGEPIMVEMLPAGDGGANVLQIGNFPDAEGLMLNAAAAQSRNERAAADEAARVEHERLQTRTPLQKIRDRIVGLFRKDS